MKCETVKKELEILLFENIPIPKELAVHVSGCPSCSSYLTQTKQLYSHVEKTLLNETKKDSYFSSLTQSILTKIENEEQKKFKINFIPYLAFAGTCASFLLIMNIVSHNQQQQFISRNAEMLKNMDIFTQYELYSDMDTYDENI